MGHPPRAVWLPTDAYPLLALTVERISAAHGGEPAELVALLRTGSTTSTSANQLAALAWVLDAAREHVLLVRHPGLGWSCPGGHVEQGEEPDAAAARELREETGMTLEAVSADPVTLSRDVVAEDDRGPAHAHWTLGYQFVGDPHQPLRAEPDRPAGWFAIAEIPAPAVQDLAPLLARLAKKAE